MTQAEFDALLRWLDPDRDRAAEKYEAIRGRLIKFLTWRGAQFPEAYADETIDRVARHMAVGVVVQAPDPYKYFAGVAWNVYNEMQRKAQRASKKVPVPPGPPEDPHKQERLDECMKRCLRELSVTDRELMIKYHTGEKRARIENRERMAKELGISPNALRLQCSRIRKKLDDCMDHCMKR